MALRLLVHGGGGGKMALTGESRDVTYSQLFEDNHPVLACLWWMVKRIFRFHRKQESD